MRTVKFATSFPNTVSMFAIALRAVDRQVGSYGGHKVSARAPNCRKYFLATEYRTKIITNGKLR